MRRPLSIAIPGVILLWELGLYVTGIVWYQALLWSMLAYAISCALFALVGTIRRLWLHLALVVILIVLMRLLVAF